MLVGLTIGPIGPEVGWGGAGLLPGLPPHLVHPHFLLWPGGPLPSRDHWRDGGRCPSGLLAPLPPAPHSLPPEACLVQGPSLGRIPHHQAGSAPTRGPRGPALAVPPQGSGRGVCVNPSRARSCDQRQDGGDKTRQARSSCWRPDRRAAAAAAGHKPGRRPGLPGAAGPSLPHAEGWPQGAGLA